MVTTHWRSHRCHLRQTGANGQLQFLDGKTLETEVEYVEGLKWTEIYFSLFITDSKGSKVEFEKPLIS